MRAAMLGSRAAALPLLLVAALAATPALSRTLTLAVADDAGVPVEGTSSPVTVPFNFTRPRGSLMLPDSDPRVGQAFYNGVSPEQIRVLYYGPTEIMFSWVTGNASVFVGDIVPRDTSLESSEVQLRAVGEPQISSASRASEPAAVGPASASPSAEANDGESSRVLTYEGVVDQYSYNYDTNIPDAHNYTSGVIHRVRVAGLEPGQQYVYRVGSSVNDIWSDWLNFTMPGSSTTYPITFGIIGDGGHTYNSSTTYDHMLAVDPDMVVWVGDLCYADTSYSNGSLYRSLSIFNETDPVFPGKNKLTKLGTYQPRWDMWSRLTSPLTSSRPFVYTIGNHEIERQSNGVRYSAFNHRLPPNSDQSGSTLYYSFNAGPVHWVILASYAEYGPDSDQVAWLIDDLESVDRDVTPWVIVGNHEPMINSYVAGYYEVECYRQTIEPILYENNVDIVFSGHVHAYERSFPVYNFTLDPTGPVHVTVGDGGNVETVEVVYADSPGHCPAPEARKPPPYDDQFCEIFIYDGNYCSTGQPFWSAYRESSFGFATLEVLNSTTALYKWHRNQDDALVVADEVYFTRNNAAAVYE